MSVVKGLEYLNELAAGGVVEDTKIIIDPAAKETVVKWNGGWVVDDAFIDLYNDLQYNPRYKVVKELMETTNMAISCLKRVKGVVDYTDGCLWQYPYEAHLGVWYLKDGDTVHKLSEF